MKTFLLYKAISRTIFTGQDKLGVTISYTIRCKVIAYMALSFEMSSKMTKKPIDQE